MSTFDDLERALGIDLSNPDDALARDLVEADDNLLEQLVYIRKKLSGMSGVEVADRMGRNRSVVTNFEKLATDPHLSTIRRYAHAIGARITHRVEWVLPRKDEAPSNSEHMEPFGRFRVYDFGSNPNRSWINELLMEHLQNRTGMMMPTLHCGAMDVSHPAREVEVDFQRVQVSGSSALIAESGGTGR